jgi:hypothetical protein
VTTKQNIYILVLLIKSMQEKTEDWVGQLIRLRKAYAMWPSCYPRGRSDRIRFLEAALAPDDDGRVRISGRTLDNVRDEQLYAAGCNIYRTNRKRLDELKNRVASRRPSVFDSFQLLSLMEEHDLINERGRIGDVSDAVDEKMGMLTRLEQKEVLGRYGFHMYDSFWAEYKEPEQEQLQLV